MKNLTNQHIDMERKQREEREGERQREREREREGEGEEMSRQMKVRSEKKEREKERERLGNSRYFSRDGYNSHRAYGEDLDIHNLWVPWQRPVHLSAQEADSIITADMSPPAIGQMDRYRACLPW